LTLKLIAFKLNSKLPFGRVAIQQMGSPRDENTRLCWQGKLFARPCRLFGEVFYFLEFTGGLTLTIYQALSETVIINKKNRLISHDESLELVGTGRSAFVFKVKSSNKAIKLFFPTFAHIAKEEAEIYIRLQDISYYPSVYEVGLNYIVMDYVEGHTLFECMLYGTVITPDHLKEIDYALLLASNQGLNPSDIHLRNILKIFT